MSFASRLTRSPRPFDPDRGADLLQAFPSLGPELTDLIAGTTGSSPYLHGVIGREAEWFANALQGEPETAFEDILAALSAFEGKDPSDHLRQAKRRVAGLAALADLAGVWSLEETTRSLTRFADAAVSAGLKHLVAKEIERGKVPGATDADIPDAAGMAVLAMGKMGAFELNYSSDIDLICLFDETRFDPDDYADARAAFIRVTRRLTAMLSDLTGEGYVFRTDLRLRPDPSVTPVCLSMEAAERYYESVGRTWERAAYIKARVCAGDIKSGQAFLKRLTPFVWRKHLDFAAIQDAHDMRLRIREHKGLHGPIVLEGHNMKLGAGGIREIEFFTQTRQIIAGGRDPELRVSGTVEGLARLAEKGWIPDDAAQLLTQDYRAHREIEHRLQMIADAQTHDLPKNQEGFARLASLAGRDVEELRADVLKRLTRVNELTERFFAPDDTGKPTVEIGQNTRETLDRWRTYPALRSARALEIFDRILPEILSRLQAAAQPERALSQFDAFLAGLPAGVQLFSLFQANPQLVDLIVDIASTAPNLAQYLGRNSQVLDAVIGGDFFAAWPGVETLHDRLAAQLDQLDDYESKLDLARRWNKEWHFRIGVHHLRGLISSSEASTEYAQLAEAVVGAVFTQVQAEFTRKYGAPPGRGATVLGMGSLGSAQLTASSDLDLIVIYDPQGQDASEGRRPLATRAYYARLTQALVTALTAPMAEGRLYEVDMRLRPSGRQGPVATSFDAFRDYQMSEAWTWEHLALTRARAIAGCKELGADVEAFRQELLGGECQPAKVISDAQDMRQRLAEAKPSQGDWEAKFGAGHLQDIELLAQVAALLSGSPAQDVQGQIAAGKRAGWLKNEDAVALVEAFTLLRSLQMAARLLTGRTLDIEAIGRGGEEFVLRETNCASIAELAALKSRLTAAATVIIDKALQAVPQ